MIIPPSYAKAKWIVDHLMAYARAYGLIGGIFRIGQICGDSQHGIWNQREAIPLLIQAASVLGVVPYAYVDGKDQVSWMPVDHFAEGLVAAVVHHEDTGGNIPVWNFSNPHPTPWRRIVRATQRALPGGARAVPYDQWLDILKAHRKDSRVLAPKLLPYYSSGLFPAQPFEHVAVAATLAKDRLEGRGSWEFCEIDEALIIKMIIRWMEEGFIASAGPRLAHLHTSHRDAKL
ncbi:hypothetical protein BD324DRAFT_618987 [Kockovaella imperatae]|uniref:Thioester reductase (TE) domain-containing protein n=1 Tax=Kockovaella imperatae TaxID=4999 RepID=A0A1Y1UNY0_9TREE|nr:hypothetical protein BD324DRAFT_618987 [Kockovaella imperatae]ORX39247.1 hypothetical protein BD324DRAFT_618987 [Kockovaella imperatae]